MITCKKNSAGKKGTKCNITSEMKSILSRIDARIQSLYTALPNNAMLIVCTGHGNTSLVQRCVNVCFGWKWVFSERAISIKIWCKKYVGMGVQKRKNKKYKSDLSSKLEAYGSATVSLAQGWLCMPNSTLTHMKQRHTFIKFINLLVVLDTDSKQHKTFDYKHSINTWQVLIACIKHYITNIQSLDHLILTANIRLIHIRSRSLAYNIRLQTLQQTTTD